MIKKWLLININSSNNSSIKAGKDLSFFSLWFSWNQKVVCACLFLYTCLNYMYYFFGLGNPPPHTWLCSKVVSHRCRKLAVVNAQIRQSHMSALCEVNSQTVFLCNSQVALFWPAREAVFRNKEFIRSKEITCIMSVGKFCLSSGARFWIQYYKNE